MSWTVVARKDFRDAGRSRMLWVVTALFVILGAVIVYALASLAGGDLEAIGAIGTLQSSMSLFIPIVALLLGHKAIVGERETGSLKFLLSLPHTRLDAVIGKFVGRTVVLWLAVLLGFVASLAVWAAVAGMPDVAPLAAFVALTLLYAAAYVSVAVGLSAAVSSGSLATVLAIGVWILFQYVWSLGILAIRYVAGGFSIEVLSSPQPTWAAFLSSLSPPQAWGNAVIALIPGFREQFGDVLGDSVFSEPWWSLLVLLAWLVGALALGYLRFRRADL